MPILIQEFFLFHCSLPPSEVAYVKDHFAFFLVDGLPFMVYKAAEHR